VNLVQLKAVFMAIHANTQAAFSAGQAARVAINAATTNAAADAISFSG
jgi:hypothetical protein